MRRPDCPEAAPVPAIDADRHADLLKHDVFAAAHVAGIALYEVGAQVLAGGKPFGIVEDAPVAAVGCIPGDVAGTLCLRIHLVVNWQIAVSIETGTKG